jgi:hypothetical protein
VIPYYETDVVSKPAAFDKAQREWTTPPFPLSEVDQVDTVMTARQVWHQTIPDREPTTSGWPTTPAEAEHQQREAEQRLARRAAATRNPLRELASALVAFADQLDEHGVVPLAINLTTGHQAVFESVASERHAFLAQVHVTVRGLRQQWVDARTAEEPE